MIYIGIDQSYTGFGLVAYEDETGDHRTVLGKFPPTKYGSGVDRLIAINTWLATEVQALCFGQSVNISHVAMEGYANGAKFGREAAGELGAAVKMALRSSLPESVCYPTIVAPTALKKFVLGKATTGKDKMILGIYKKWGAEFDDNNLADAYALARVAEAVVKGANLAYEREVLNALTKKA